MTEKNQNKNIFTKGAVTILLSVLLLSILLVIGLGVSALMLQQIKLSGQIGKSVVAFYAADSGAEKCLYDVRQLSAGSCPYSGVPLDFDSQATYTTSYNGTNQITSIGQFRGAGRKVELSW
jgi:hypothetical protein